MSFCNKCGEQTKLDGDHLCDECMGKVIASCKCGNCPPRDKKLDESDKLRANGAVIESGPAVSLHFEPVPGGQRVSRAEAIQAATESDARLSAMSKAEVDRDAASGIDWSGTSLVPPDDLPSTETLFHALEHRFKAQAAELRAMRLREDIDLLFSQILRCKGR